MQKDAVYYFGKANNEEKIGGEEKIIKRMKRNFSSEFTRLMRLKYIVCG